MIDFSSLRVVKWAKLACSLHGSLVAKAENGCGREGSVHGPNIIIKPREGFVGCYSGYSAPVLECSL